jgi:hypothetical protein
LIKKHRVFDSTLQVRVSDLARSSVGDLVCAPIEATFVGLVDCTCDIPISWPLTTSYANVTCTTPICDPAYSAVCIDITIGAAVTVAPVVLSAFLCVGNIQIFDFTLPADPFCIDYKTVSAGKTSIVKGCTATVKGKKCRRCKTFGKLGGVKFDCTNVVQGFKSLKVIELRPYLGSESHPSMTVPQI